MIDLLIIAGNITCNGINGKIDLKSGKEQKAKANSHPHMTTSDDNYDPFMVSMCYILQMGMVCRLCATSYSQIWCMTVLNPAALKELFCT